MRYRSVCSVIVTFLVSPAPTVVAAQVIEGTVMSAEESPLPHVTVVLFDESYQRQAQQNSDERGRFSFSGLEPGGYVLSVEQPGRASVVSPSLEVSAGDTIVHQILAEAPTVQSMVERSRLSAAREAFERRVTSVCGDESSRSDGAILAGVVRDTLSGLGLPAANVVLRWVQPDGEEAEASARTSDDGSYVICDAPVGEEVVLRVDGLGRGGDLLGVTLDPGTAHILDIPVNASESEEPGQVMGRVVEYETGRGITDAEVHLSGPEKLTALTSSRGYFVLRDVPPGRFWLSVEHLGYGRQEQSFVVLPGRAHEIDVRLVTEAIELEPIEVTVRSERWMYFMDGLQFRMRQGFGHFILREDIETRGPNVPVGSVIDGLPGVEWRRRRGYDAEVTIRRRCRPVIWLDGMRTSIPVFAADGLRSTEIEAIEVYTFPGSVPAEFGGGVACGAIVIWTRRF